MDASKEQDRNSVRAILVDGLLVAGADAGASGTATVGGSAQGQGRGIRPWVAGSTRSLSVSRRRSTDTTATATATASTSAGDAAEELPALPVVLAGAAAAAVGASLLSAAELDSSKAYLQLDSGCQIAYMVRCNMMGWDVVDR
jgi:hypothetical protein